MLGEVVMTEHEITGRRKARRSIAMASYPMDSHNVQRYVAKDENGNLYVSNEGDFEVEVKQPYTISYGSILPQEQEC